MSDQLFRFSVLRAAEPSGGLSPIVVATDHVRIDDRLAQVAAQTVAWLSAADLATATTQQVVDGLAVDPQQWDAAMTEGLVNLARRQVVVALREMASAPSTQTRRAFSAAVDLLTASALLATLGTAPPETPVREWIRVHPVQIDFDSLLPSNLWRPRTALVRAPSVSDHFVVRQQLVGYDMGEINDVKNYLKGELKDHSLRYLSVSEEETVNETETQDNRSTETATQQRSSMKSAAQATASSSVGLDARVRTDGQYGPTKVSTDVGFQYSSTSSEASQTAAEFSTEVMEKSVEEVRERELNRVTRRRRTELEEVQDHKVDNTLGAGHTIGIYRWVDSLWKATTYAVGQRLILEFLIPEPGRAVLQARATEPVDPEPAPTAPPANLYDTLDARQAATLGAQYGATGIKAPPLETQVVGVPFGSTEFKDSSGERVQGVVVKDVKIPKGYVGQTVFVAVTGMEREDVDRDSNIVVDVPGARPATFLDEPGGLTNPFLVTSGTGRPNPGVHTLVLETKSNFGPESTVPVTVYAEDMRGLTGTVEVQCLRTVESFDTWKLETIEKIVGAYRTRLSEWEARRAAAAFDVPPPAPSPDLDALCRHACISSLLGSWPAPVPVRSDSEGWPVPGALAGKTGELIEFMEQAFEWSNLQYVAYPYYWADRSRWPELMGHDEADPKVRELLRSGAVRMVVPVRLDLSEAVLFFLATGIPWFGGSAPIPGEPGYVAIADEIRTSRVGDHDGETVVGEFSYRLPTSLTILQETGVLPAPVA